MIEILLHHRITGEMQTFRPGVNCIGILPNHFKHDVEILINEYRSHGHKIEEIRRSILTQRNHH